MKTTGEPSSRGRFSLFLRRGEKGNALLYVLLAVGLLAALTYYYVQDSNGSYASENAIHISEELYSQINMIKAAVVECTLEYPAGGPDVNGDSQISSSENPNNPFPINPSNTNNLHDVAGCSSSSPPTPCISAAAANDDVINLMCPGAKTVASANMFSGTGNQGRYLPPMPSQFNPWVYTNDGTGVYITTTIASPDPTSIDALDRLMNKFTTTQAVHTTGSTSFKVWIKQ